MVTNGPALWDRFQDITHIKVVHFEFDRVNIFQGISLPDIAHFFLW